MIHEYARLLVHRFHGSIIPHISHFYKEAPATLTPVKQSIRITLYTQKTTCLHRRQVVYYTMNHTTLLTHP